MVAFILLVQGDLLGQSKRVLYSVAAHTGNIPSYDIVFYVRAGNHQISGGYVTSNHSPGTVKVIVPGFNFGYRYYPRRSLSKFNGFFSADLFIQGYQSPDNQSTTVGVEWTYLFFGGGVKYSPIPRLFIEAAGGLGPGTYKYEEISPTGTIGSRPGSFQGSGRVGIGYQFNE